MQFADEVLGAQQLADGPLSHGKPPGVWIFLADAKEPGHARSEAGDVFGSELHVRHADLLRQINEAGVVHHVVAGVDLLGEQVGRRDYGRGRAAHRWWLWLGAGLRGCRGAGGGVVAVVGGGVSSVGCCVRWRANFG